MIQQRTANSVFSPLILVLMLAFTLAAPASAMHSGHKGGAHEKHCSMKGSKGMKGMKGHGRMGRMHGSMGLTMSNVMPGKTMKFLDHFKSWIEITPEQEPAWNAFSRAIKLQATSKPHMKHRMHMMMQAGPAAMAEMQIVRAEKMLQMKKNTLAAYKALLEVLDEQQAGLADSFLAHQMTGHKHMKKGKGKRGH